MTIGFVQLEQLVVHDTKYKPGVFSTIWLCCHSFNVITWSQWISFLWVIVVYPFFNTSWVIRYSLFFTNNQFINKELRVSILSFASRFSMALPIIGLYAVSLSETRLLDKLAMVISVNVGLLFILLLFLEMGVTSRNFLFKN